MHSKFNNTLKLYRYPRSKQQNLQAWDAADEYLFEHILTYDTPQAKQRMLIFNDSFGALSLALQKFQPDVVTDSIVSKIAIIKNAELNKIQTANLFHSLSDHTGKYDYVLIKLPKTLDYLRYFLTKIRLHIDDNTKVIVAGMIKFMPKTVWQALEDLLGNTTTSLAKKKARLIFVKVEKNIQQTPFPTSFQLKNSNLKIFNHANVFSKQSLDIGTRFLLQNLPKLADIKTIIDLGCGNGIVGLHLTQQYPQAQITFTDESYMAVASAKLTAEYNLKTISQHHFMVNNCLDGFTKKSVDLIVCNPPFHQSHSIGLNTAVQMLQQSFSTLKQGGHFIVVANRHLPYYSHLKRIFANVVIIASNHKFNIFQMRRQR
ncbi:MAG: methyltransferase [Proteobacteria bacterium]|nr:methyltransferase [Pseudomonadota bacterium]